MSPERSLNIKSTTRDPILVWILENGVFHPFSVFMVPLLCPGNSIAAQIPSETIMSEPE